MPFKPSDGMGASMTVLESFLSGNIESGVARLRMHENGYNGVRPQEAVGGLAPEETLIRFTQGGVDVDNTILKDPCTEIVLYLHLTRDCNLRCSYCYSGEKNKLSMPPDVARRAVDLFLEGTDHLKVRFFGGEPLLEFPLLREIVTYCKQEASRRSKKIEYAVITNGTLLTEEMAAFFAEQSIEYSVSFDGHREAQDVNRRTAYGSGSFEMLHGNIPHMLRWNPYLHVVRVISPNNVAMLAKSVEFYLEKGFSVISFSPDYTHSGFRDSLPVLKSEYLKVADFYLASRKQGKAIYFNIFDHLNTLFRRGKCRFGRQDFSVDVCGDIYPCCCFADHKVYRLGNIDRGPDPQALEILAAEIALLEQHMERDHRDCPDTSFCKIGCGCTNMVTSRKLSVIDPVICEYGLIEEEVRKYVSAGLTGDLCAE